MRDKHFDILILGGGLSGMQLALAMIGESYFSKFSIGIVEASKKDKQDRNWSFWEKGRGQWDNLIHHQWNSATFFGPSQSIKFDLGDYSYKTIRSIDFYRHARSIIESSNTIDWIEDEIVEVFSENHQCKGKNYNYKADFLFDGVSKVNWKEANHPTVLQHFSGWVIETSEEVFDAKTFCMMDYRLPFEDRCAFTYILPYSSNKALIEYTFFSPEVEAEAVYEEQIQRYIQEILKIDQYTVSEKEKGIIPMSTFPFEDENRSRYLKIGTLGGWVKASSGYSFKNTEKKVKILIENLKSKRPLNSGMTLKRFQYYDRIFLRILQEKNHLGASLFEQLYAANNIESIFAFLDEETSVWQEIKIMNQFKKGPFLKSLFKELTH